MIIIKPSAHILTPFGGTSIATMLQSIEFAGRVCYKSEDKITRESTSRFVRDIVQVKHHESVIEHISVTVRFVVDRGVSHELVRHRLASFSQESTRYCNYSKDKFDGQLTFIHPFFFAGAAYVAWEEACLQAERSYLYLLKIGRSPQEARSVLPNSLKTEVVMTANLREWRHIFKLRTAKAAHPQMREVMIPLLIDFRVALPELFDDITESEAKP